MQMPTQRPISPTFPLLYRKLNYNLFQHWFILQAYGQHTVLIFLDYTKIQKQRLALCRQESFSLESKSHTVSMVEFALSQQTSSPAATVWGSLTLDLVVFKFQMQVSGKQKPSNPSVGGTVLEGAGELPGTRALGFLFRLVPSWRRIKVLLRGRCQWLLLVLIGCSLQRSRGLESTERWVVLAPEHCKGNQESASPSSTENSGGELW